MYKEKSITPMQITKDLVIIPPLVGEFKIHENFLGGRVRYHFNDLFKKHILNPAKDFEDLPEMGFCEYLFNQTHSDVEIMRKFSISHSLGLLTREQVLWIIYKLTSGKLANDFIDDFGIIIGYVECEGGVIRPVEISFDKDNNEYECYVYEPGRWIKNDRVWKKIG